MLLLRCGRLWRDDRIGGALLRGCHRIDALLHLEEATSRRLGALLLRHYVSWVLLALLFLRGAHSLCGGGDIGLPRQLTQRRPDAEQRRVVKVERLDHRVVVALRRAHAFATSGGWTLGSRFKQAE